MLNTDVEAFTLPLSHSESLLCLQLRKDQLEVLSGHTCPYPNLDCSSHNLNFLVVVVRTVA